MTEAQMRVIYATYLPKGSTVSLLGDQIRVMATSDGQCLATQY